MNPELLKTFISASMHNSYTRAAEDRLLSQPAVSRQIKQLERQLGVSLFEKLGKAIQLTDAGRALVPQAAELLGQMDRVVEHVRAVGSTGIGRLRIGASTTPGLYFLPPILGTIHRSYPQLELNYVIENSLSIERRIVRNELDLAFVGERPQEAALVAEQVFDDRVVCFCGVSHELAAKRRIAPSALSDVTWVIREPGSATRQLFERAWKSCGGKIRRTIELCSPEGIKELIAAGIGVSFMSSRGIRRETRDHRIFPLHIDGFQLTRPIYVVRHKEKHASRAMTEFLTAVRDSDGCQTLK